MSEGGKTPGDSEEGFVDLTALDFGPAWARDPAKGKGGEKKEGAPGRERREQGGDRDRREKGRGGEQRERGRRDDRRGGGQGGRQEGKRSGGGRSFDKGGQRGRHGGAREERERGPRREEVPAPEGVTGTVMPVEEGLDNLAKEIMAGGRTYSVFDLAKLVMGARDRFNVTFKAGGGRKLFFCRKDGSVWLDRSEASRHLWRADWFGECYEEVVREVDPPKGNFQAVAKCGISGEILGPPNYHGYQTAIVALHRERFGHMSLDQYKRKIVMERSEEAVNAWLESMSKRLQYRPTGGKRPAKPAPDEARPAEAAGTTASGEAGAEEAPAEAPSGGGRAREETALEEAPAADEAAAPAAEESAAPAAAEAADEAETDVAEAAAEGGEDGAAESAPAPDPVAEAPPADVDTGPLLADKNEVERHFNEHLFKKVYQETDRAWVPGNIPGNRISPGLLTLLRTTVAEERRYPGRLTPILCRQFSGRHVAVFKWRKQLKAGPSRPHSIPSDISIADRPRQLLEWVQAKSGSTLEKLWKELLPANADDKTKHEWYHDLHWVLNQGYVLLLGDSTLHIAKRDGGQLPGKAGAKGPGKGKKDKQKEKAKGKETRRRRKRVIGRPGLYAWSSMTTAGQPKLQNALTASGLWPLESRMNAVEEAISAEDEEQEAVPRRIWRDLSFR